MTVIPDSPPSIEDEQPWSFDKGIPIFFQDFALAWEILVDKGFLEVAVQCRKGHTTAGAIDCLLLRVSGVFAHKIAEFQVHPRFTQSLVSPVLDHGATARHLTHFAGIWEEKSCLELPEDL